MALTTEQRTHLEKRLQDERGRAAKLLRGMTGGNAGDGSDQEQSGDLTKVPFHMADLGTDTMDEELDASNATRVSEELAEIDAALERLIRNPETFGTDENNGKPIAFERLDIIPWARTAKGTG